MAYSTRTILAEFRRQFGRHDRPAVDHEHGGTWVTCSACGACWSVNESNKGPNFERIAQGDESCRAGR